MGRASCQHTPFAANAFTAVWKKPHSQRQARKLQGFHDGIHAVSLCSIGFPRLKDAFCQHPYGASTDPGPGLALRYGQIYHPILC